MANVTYDDRSFIINGERIWLVSGSLHYFRVPAELWSDRLLKAKRAGLNCISTYIPWNYHEPQEGKWRLTGDQDVVEFVNQAEEQGLYVILRPGPYIRAGWDSGGLPAWLTARSGMSYRTSNAAYMHYFDKYFRRVLPRLAEFQVTRGGNIILIQNENEYFMTTMPDRMNYLSFINQLFRRSGFEIPIINCNRLSDPPVPENVECVNTRTHAIERLKQMRLRQPDAPLLVTEFRLSQPVCWGAKQESSDDRDVGRRALEILGCGGQFNYYMWHGGTNFGFWGGQLALAGDSYQTTSNDGDSPLAEGGGLTPRYYLTRLVNMLASHMGPYLAACAMEAPGASIHDSTDMLNIYGSTGRWAIITNSGREDITTAEVSLPAGKHLRVSLDPLGAVAIPIDVRLTPMHTLDYSNLMPLGLFGEKILVLHGPAEFDVRVSINGREIRDVVPGTDEPKIIEHQGLFVVLVHSALAMRTWLVEDSLIFGAKFVGQTLEDIEYARDHKQCAVLSMEGKLSHKKAKVAIAKKPTPPRLGQWTRRRVCTEPVAKDLKWTKIDRPMDLDRLGVHYGYGWYQVRIDSDRARKRYLLLPNCRDRATVYVNGRRIGVWGCGEGATRSPMPASFKRGQNLLTILADNLGRMDSGSRLGELKGLFGHVFDAKLLRTKKFKIKQQEGFSKRVIPRQLSHMAAVLEELPVLAADLDIRLTKVTPLHLSFTNLPFHVAVLCNERVVGFYPNYGTNFGDLTLGPELKKGRNDIKLLLWGDVTAKAMDNVKFHTLNENITQKARWAFRPWQLPTGEGPVVGKGRPAWYVSKFKYVPQNVPLFLRILSAKKGQIFLNGRNVGRFWNVGPQQRYDRPECWMEAENELLIFEEQGNIPASSRLEFCPSGPQGD